MPLDTSSWPTKDEACTALGVSLSQVNNLIKQRRLEVRKQKRPGLPPIGKVNPTDVRREQELREARATQAHVMPAEAAPAVPAIRVPAAYNALELLLQALPAPNAVDLSRKLWLTFPEAVVFTGLGQYRLRELVRSQQVRTEHGPHRKTVLARADLEAWTGF